MANEATRIIARRTGNPEVDSVVAEVLDQIWRQLDAHALPYNASVLTDWASPAPTTVGAALDRVAARLTTSGTPP